MRVDRGIASRTSQVLVRIEGDVLLLRGVVVSFYEAKVDHVHLGALSTHAHQKVVRLQITMNHVLLVQVAYKIQHLVEQDQGGVQGELPVTKVEEIFQGWAQDLGHYIPDPVVEVFTGGNQFWYTLALHVLDHVCLIGCLRVSRVDGFRLDCNLLMGPNING